MKAVFLLFDSLNRHALSCYAQEAPPTPNFERLARRSVVFDRHFVGSLPCMPARRDIQSGRLNFLHRGWGPLEPFDHSIADMLRGAGVCTHLVTDHYHYFEDGGFGYHGRYSSWEFVRGQEKDKWRPPIAPAAEAFAARYHELQHDFAPADLHGKLPYYLNRDYLEASGTFPLTQCFDSGCAFLDAHHADDGWLLHLECFDPHEPFFAPERFLADRPELLGGRIFDWPSYGRVGDLAPALVDELRARYHALVAACDDELGRLLDAFDRHDLWRDTWIVLSTDHGLLLGEKQFLGKNRPPFYNEVAHIPLLIAPPATAGIAPRRSGTLTQTIDIAPTLLEIFGLPVPAEMTGRSLVPVLAHDDPSRADGGIVFGQFGAAINWTDGRHAYFLYPHEPFEADLFQYTLMPTHMRTFFEAGEFADAELVPPLPFTRGYPVLKLPLRRDAKANMTRRYPLLDARTVLFDLAQDPDQRTPIQDDALEARIRRDIAAALARNDAPAELYARYGLAPSRAAA
jgi:arylsulfatase A-like enzyme